MATKGQKFGRYKMPRTLEERFMDSVSPEPNSGCWLWTGAAAISGYGTLSIPTDTNERGHKTVTAHRLALTLFGDGDPKDAIVRHTCDNRICVNPSHLRAGTIQDNVRDMWAKGRHPWCSGVPNRWAA